MTLLRRYFFRRLTVVLFPLLLLASHSKAHAYGLQDAISDAIRFNPNQEANQLQVEAAELDAEAAKKSAIYPGVSASIGVSRSTSSGTFSSGSSSASANLGVSKTLYDGGATDHQVRAAELQARVLKAQQLSDDSFVPNTSGQLASIVFTYYGLVAFHTDLVDFYRKQIDLLSSLLPLRMSQNDRDLILSSIRSNQLSVVKSDASIAKSKEELESRGVNLPTGYDGLEETDRKLSEILRPYIQNPDLALRTAEKQNQNFIAKKLNLELQRERDAATKAALTSPNVSLSIGANYSRSLPSGTGSASYSWNKNAGITLSIPIGAGYEDTLKASAKRVEAAQKQVDFEEKRFRHEIVSSIRQIASVEEVLKTYRTNLEFDRQKLNDFVSGLLRSGVINGPDTQTLFSFMDNVANGFSSLESEMFNSSTYARFQLQASIGILLNSVEANRAGRLLAPLDR